MPVSLIQLIDDIEGEKVIPRYDIENIDDFKEKQESPRVEFYGFGDIPENYKERLLQHVDGSFRGLGISTDLKTHDIDSLIETLQENREILESFDFKDYHTFWKIFKKKSTEERFGIYADIFFAITLFPTIEATPYFLGFPVFMESVSELTRRKMKREGKEKIGKLEQSLEIYNTYRDNIERSEIDKKETPEAQRLIETLRDITGISPWFILDGERINSDLLKSYNLKSVEKLK